MSQYGFVMISPNSDNDESTRYKFIKKLGEGAYASILLAEFYNFDSNEEPLKKVACKVIDTIKTPAEYRVKFLPRELEILRKVHHPHIIHIYAIIEKGTKFLIFMRYAEYGDLLEYTSKTGAILEDQSRMWTKQIALAIQYLHELDIAHRDLKCENILVTANFNVKLTDFGFARCLLNKRGVRMLSETYCGSASYSAPEILKGLPYNPKISDMWSLGVVIFVMMNRAFPFEDVSIKKLYELQMSKKWKFKPRVEATASKQVKDLMHHLLEPNAERRYIVSQLLNSEWIFMDHRLIGMTEDESLALVRAREERQKMEKDFNAPQQVDDSD